MTMISHAQNFEDVMLWRALKHVEAGGVAVVDVITEPGYTPAMTAALNNAGAASSPEKK